MNCSHPECTGWHTTRTGSNRNRIKVSFADLCPAYLERKRAVDANRQRRARARQSGKDLDEIEPVRHGHEVLLVPGMCVAWTPWEGRCTNPANGQACIKHEWDFVPLEARNAARRTRLTDEDYAFLATVPTCEREKARKRLVTQRARQDPEYRERENARRRERANRAA